MSKQALKRVRRELKLEVNREPLPAYAWPGGYPLVYIFNDGGCCCADCANDNIDLIDSDMKGNHRWNSHGGWALGGCDTHLEGEPMSCVLCGAVIESAYGVPDES